MQSKFCQGNQGNREEATLFTAELTNKSHLYPLTLLMIIALVCTTNAYHSVSVEIR